MSFPRYPKYKASGVSELGDLPEHWEIKPLKHFSGIDSCGCYGLDAEDGEHLLPVATTAQIDADGRFTVSDMPIRGFTLAEIQRYGCGVGDILVVKSSGSATNIISGKAGLVANEYTSIRLQQLLDADQAHERSRGPAIYLLVAAVSFDPTACRANVLNNDLPEPQGQRIHVRTIAPPFLSRANPYSLIPGSGDGED